MNLHLVRAQSLQGEMQVPGDKSITHRALLFASLATGISFVRNYLDAADCLATMSCLRGLGVPVIRRQHELAVHGRGMHGWQEPADVLDCQRSGTAMRLLAGLLAGQDFTSVLSGRAQLRARPMGRVITPLQAMGAQIFGRGGNRLPPLSIIGSPLHGITYHSPVASAQVASCLLLAGMYAQGMTTVIEPDRSRDHTLRMLQARGAAVAQEGTSLSVQGPVESLAATDVHIPGDISSAAYFLVAGLLVPGSSVVVKSVGINPTRTGLLDALRAMGAVIEAGNEHDEGGEPIADLAVRYEPLRSAVIRGELIPRLIDEIPILALAATQAEGETVIRDAAELRVKETDRIASTVLALRALGANVEPREDGLVVQGPTRLHGALVDSQGDHRIAMMAVIAGLIADGDTYVTHIERVQDSFPGFVQTLQHIAPGAVQ